MPSIITHGLVGIAGASAVCTGESKLSKRLRSFLVLYLTNVERFNIILSKEKTMIYWKATSSPVRVAMVWAIVAITYTSRFCCSLITNLRD